MRLRKLQIKDNERIFSWMKAPDVNRYFRFDSSKITIESINEFIENAQDTQKNMHLAIVDDEDNYLGTVSLKNIDYESGTAEYAISIIRELQGKGVAVYATKELLKIAFEKLNLNKVFLNVFADNIRADKFYKKLEFTLEGEFREHVFAGGSMRSLKWYSMLKREYSANVCVGGGGGAPPRTN